MSNDYEKGVVWFRAQAPEFQSLVVEKIVQASPALTVGSFSRKVATDVGGANLIGIDQLISFVSGFVIAATADGSFCKQLAEYAADSAQPDSDLVQNFRKLFSCESLFITKKAQDVMWGHGRVFKEATVVSQIRPVFFNDIERSPTSAVIVHELRIDALNGNEEETWRIAMDVTRARQLIGVLNRAIEKESKLRNEPKFTYLLNE